jgi:hypothetical protein
MTKIEIIDHRLANIAQASVYNPTPGSYHYLEFRDQCKDGNHVEGRLSEYVIGLTLLATQLDQQGARYGLDLKKLEVWEAALCQLPFVFRDNSAMGLRNKYVRLPNRSFPGEFRFIGPDGNPFPLFDCDAADLDWKPITQHINFLIWLDQHMFAGRGIGSQSTYTLTKPTLLDKDAYDDRVNGPYALAHGITYP